MLTCFDNVIVASESLSVGESRRHIEVVPSFDLTEDSSVSNVDSLHLGSSVSEFPISLGISHGLRLGLGSTGVAMESTLVGDGSVDSIGQSTVERSSLVLSAFREAESSRKDGSLVSVGVVLGSDSLGVEHSGSGNGSRRSDISSQSRGSGVSHDSVHTGSPVAEGDFSREASSSFESNGIVVLKREFVLSVLEEVGGEFRVGESGSHSILFGVGFGVGEVEIVLSVGVSEGLGESVPVSFGNGSGVGIFLESMHIDFRSRLSVPGFVPGSSFCLHGSGSSGGYLVGSESVGESEN